MEGRTDRASESESPTATPEDSSKQILDCSDFYRTRFQGIEPEDQPTPESLVFSEGRTLNRNRTVPIEGTVVNLRTLMEIIYADIHQREMMLNYDLEALTNLFCLSCIGETIRLKAHISTDFNFNRAVKEIPAFAPRLIVQKISSGHFLLKGVMTWGVINDRSICSPNNVGDLGMHSFGAAGGNTVNPNAIPRMS